MELFDNGIIIQTTERPTTIFSSKDGFTDVEFDDYCSYKGIDRYKSWPLQYCSDQLSRRLTSLTKKWFEIPCTNGSVLFNSIIPERKFCHDYVKQCQKLGIKIRIIFCQTEAKITTWDSEIPESMFIGYDYADFWELVSTIPDDLLNPERDYLEYPLYKALVQCKENLNQNKLFSSEKDIMDYLEKREDVINAQKQSSENKENFIRPDLVVSSSSLVIFRLSEVTGNFL